MDRYLHRVLVLHHLRPYGRNGFVSVIVLVSVCFFALFVDFLGPDSLRLGHESSCKVYETRVSREPSTVRRGRAPAILPDPGAPRRRRLCSSVCAGDVNQSSCR